MQRSRLHKNLLVAMMMFFLISGIGGLLPFAHADNNEEVSLSACDGDKGKNKDTSDPNDKYVPYFEEERDADGNLVKDENGNQKYVFNDDPDAKFDNSCSVCQLDDETHQFSSKAFEDICKDINEGREDPKDAVDLMLNGCNELKSGDPYAGKCKKAAEDLESTLNSCKTENYLTDPSFASDRQNKMAYYCQSACVVDEALRKGSTKNLFDRIGEAIVAGVKAVIKVIVDVLSALGRMLSCLFAGKTDVDTLPTRSHFAKVIWFAPIVRALLGGVNIVAYDTRDVVIKYALQLLGIGLLFWLAFRILKMVGSQQNVDLEKFLTDIGKGFMRCIVASSMLICYKTGVFDLFLIPVAESFSLATVMIVDASGAETGTDSDNVVCCGEDGNGECIPGDSSVSVSGIMADAGIDEKIDAMLPGVREDRDGADNIVIRLGRPIVRAITYINTRLMMIMADGWGLVKYGIYNSCFFCLIPLFNYIGVGVIFMAFAGILALMIPLKYLDALIKMGIAICLTPFFITAWAFPSTRKYAMKGLNLFMHTFILVLVMSIAAVVCLECVAVAFGNFSGCPTASSIMNVIDFQSEDDTKNPFLFLLTVIVMIIACIKLIKAAPEIAGNISGAPGDTNVGDSLGRAMGRVGATGAKAAGAVAGAAASGVKSTATAAKDAFMQTKMGHALASKVSNSAPARFAKKAGAAITAPGRALKSYLDDRRDYKLAKSADKGFVQGAGISLLKGNALDSDTVARLESIAGKDGPKGSLAWKAKMALALNKKRDDNAMQNEKATQNETEKVKNDADNRGKKAVEENTGTQNINEKVKNDNPGKVEEYKNLNGGKPSLMKSIKNEYSKLGFGKQKGGKQSTNSVASDAGSTAKDASKEQNGQSQQTENNGKNKTDDDNQEKKS